MHVAMAYRSRILWWCFFLRSLNFFHYMYSQFIDFSISIVNDVRKVLGGGGVATYVGRGLGYS